MSLQCFLVDVIAVYIQMIKNYHYVNHDCWGRRFQLEWWETLHGVLMTWTSANNLLLITIASKLSTIITCISKCHLKGINVLQTYLLYYTFQPRSYNLRKSSLGSSLGSSLSFIRHLKFIQTSDQSLSAWRLAKFLSKLPYGRACKCAHRIETVLLRWLDTAVAKPSFYYITVPELIFQAYQDFLDTL